MESVVVERQCPTSTNERETAPAIHEECSVCFHGGQFSSAAVPGSEGRHADNIVLAQTLCCFHRTRKKGEEENFSSRRRPSQSGYFTGSQVARILSTLGGRHSVSLHPVVFRCIAGAVRSECGQGSRDGIAARASSCHS